MSEFPNLGLAAFAPRSEAVAAFELHLPSAENHRENGCAGFGLGTWAQDLGFMADSL